MTTALFNTLHHICIVVPDLDEAVTFYESVGIGSWQDFPSLEPFGHELKVPNEGDFFKLKYRFAQLGELQLQLCEPAEGDTPQRAFLEEHGPGVFHLGFTVPDVDEAEARGQELGLAVLLHGRLPNRNGFTYFDTADRGAGVVLQVRRSVAQ